MDFVNLKKEDKVIYDLMKKELKRQEKGIELIASENFVSRAVMEAMGSHLTNKYAEGYPGKRYYGGCGIVDKVEEIARQRAKELFGAEHVNVQPHSGSQANMAVYFTILKPGDTVLGMDLSNGGHLTHGSPVNFSGKLFNFVSYGVDENTETIDYNNVRELALKHKPKLIVAGASAYSRIIDFKKFKEICDEVNAYFMVDMAHIAGLVATGAHPSPVPYADLNWDTIHGEFIKGNVPYMISGPWSLAEAKTGAEDNGFEFGVTTIPTINGVQPETFSGNIIACVSAYTQHPTEAKQVAEFLASEEGLQIMYDVQGKIPALKDASVIEGVTEDPYVAGILAQAEYAQPMPILPEMSKYWGAAETMYRSVWEGLATPEEAAAKALDDYNTALQMTD